MGQNLSRNCLGLAAFLIIILGLFEGLSKAQTVLKDPLKTEALSKLQSEKNSSGCPQDLAVLTPQLLLDLPSYSNRIFQITKRSNQDSPPFIFLASQADFRPLPLNQWQYQPLFPDTTQQVFFTVLERHYHKNQIDSQQSFYWAFFVKTDRGWQLTLLLAQLASQGPKASPLPPMDATQGAIAQTINQWLRDCQAGGIPRFRVPRN